MDQGLVTLVLSAAETRAQVGSAPAEGPLARGEHRGRMMRRHGMERPGLAAWTKPSRISRNPARINGLRTAGPPDAGAPDVGVDATSPASGAFIDVGPVPGAIQPCPENASFAPLSAFLAKPASGRVKLRGRIWLPAAYPCTTGLPESCFAAPVLALRRPDEREQRVLALIGALDPNRPLTCVGRVQALACPIPVDGSEYGVSGVTSFSYEGSVATLTVESLCRFGTERRR